jgi:hypothetical protein
LFYVSCEPVIHDNRQWNLVHMEMHGVADVMGGARDVDRNGLISPAIEDRAAGGRPRMRLHLVAWRTRFYHL